MFKAVCIKHNVLGLKVKIKKTPIMDDFDPSLTKTDLSGKELFMDGEIPMRNGRICEHDSPDDDDSYMDNKGKPCFVAELGTLDGRTIQLLLSARTAM